MRLIDADLIGLTDFEIITCDGNYKMALEILLKKIEQAPVINQWIPCSERMPEVETDVLLQFSRNMCVGFLAQDNDWKIYSGGCWFTDILEGDLQPTAWMPLPEPYKEVIENERNVYTRDNGRNV